LTQSTDFRGEERGRRGIRERRDRKRKMETLEKSCLLIWEQTPLLDLGLEEKKRVIDRKVNRKGGKLWGKPHLPGISASEGVEEVLELLG